MIEFNHITKSFNNLEVIRDLSFQVHTGDILGILGPSGVGKSTILKMIAGLEKPTKGKIKSTFQRIGYVFQEPRLLPWKTALDNVLLPLIVNGMDRKKAENKAMESLDQMGLGGFEKYFPAQLSGGMLQRVSLARAFAIKPDLLLLDEPFSALDLKLKSILKNMLLEMLEEQPITVLYVSHSPEELAEFASRIFMTFPGGQIKELQVNKQADFKEVVKGSFFNDNLGHSYGSTPNS